MALEQEVLQVRGLVYQAPNITPTLDTNVFANLDQISTAQRIPGACRGVGATSTLSKIVIVDEAAQSAQLTLHFYNASPTIASSENAALNVSDAENKAKHLGSVVVYTGHYSAFSANSVATVKSPDCALDVVSNSTDGDIYFVIQSNGTPTYGASSLTFKFSFIQS